MIEYDSDSDSVLTDDGTNKLMIKGLITSHQTQLHIHTHTHTSVTYFLVNVNIRVCHFGPDSPFSFFKSYTRTFLGRGYLKCQKAGYNLTPDVNGPNS